ncbi:MAG: hypothetical protein E7679_03500 [Ruminococcaceae bacterium]|nr:hypothetical protein [Oscillospiraceae bacterium]
MDFKNDRSRKKELDDFWDIYMITPKVSKPLRPSGKSTDTVEITVSSVLESMADDNIFKSEKLSSNLNNGGTIHKYISPVDTPPKAQTEPPELEYFPRNSLIHKVSVFKWGSPYNYYEDFYQDALRLMAQRGSKTEHVPFFSYVPQYNQLNKKQMAFYLYFRERARQGEYIEADQSYILLYVYEIINLGEAMDVRFGQSQLAALWSAYSEKYPRINKMLLEWICDYSLIHRLTPPAGLDLQRVAASCTLKEFFVAQGRNDYEDYARILLAFSSSYDFHTSKFATGENLLIYEKYVPQALAVALKALSGNGILSDVGFNDCTLPRDAYSGALCSHRIKRRIEIEYCSFSRTNDLRYMIGDMVKYCENKIRAHIGVKSRLSCYSLSVEMRKILDEFFDINLVRERKRQIKTKKQEYDVLYDLPVKPLSLSHAERIEAESWETTKDLIEAFDGEEDIEAEQSEEIFVYDSAKTDAKEESELIGALGKYADFAHAVFISDVNKQRELSAALGSMPDSIVDKINEISYDVIGDILIEHDGEKYVVIDDYKCYMEE